MEELCCFRQDNCTSSKKPKRIHAGVKFWVGAIFLFLHPVITTDIESLDWLSHSQDPSVQKSVQGAEIQVDQNPKISDYHQELLNHVLSMVEILSSSTDCLMV